MNGYYMACIVSDNLIMRQSIIYPTRVLISGVMSVIRHLVDDIISSARIISGCHITWTGNIN